MTIAVGDKLPDVKIVKAAAEGNEAVQSTDFFRGKRIALFSVPGAFTPTCSAKHLPGYVDKAAALKAKGIDDFQLYYALQTLGRTTPQALAARKP